MNNVPPQLIVFYRVKGSCKKGTWQNVLLRNAYIPNMDKDVWRRCRSSLQNRLKQMKRNKIWPNSKLKEMEALYCIDIILRDYEIG